MALLFTDSFDTYQPKNSTTLSGKYDDYSSAQTTSFTGAFNPNPAARTGISMAIKNGHLTKNLSNNYSTLAIGFAYVLLAAVYSKTILKIIDDSTTQVYLFINSARKIQVIRGDGTVLGTSSKSLTVNSWSYIEFKINISNTGSYQLIIDGISQLSNSADTQNSSNSYANKVAIGNDATSFADGIDDFYIDSSDLLGQVKIYRIFPNSSSSVAWTPLAGSNQSNIDDTTNNHDSDSTYISTSSSNSKDLYGLTNPVIESGVIKGLAHNITAKTTDGNPPTNIQPIIKVGANEYTGETKTLTTSYICYQTIWENNPATSTAWTESDITDLIAGMKTI